MPNTPFVQKKHRLMQAQRRMIWLFLLLLLVAIIVDRVYWEQMSLAKNLAAGIILAYTMQWLFMRIGQRRTRAAPKQMMMDAYVGMMVRWLVGMVGFALIFILLRPLVAWAVFLGFVVMQLGIAICLARLDK